MNAERWQQVKRLLGEVIDLDPGERERVLTERCAGDSTLLAEIESLLAADAAAMDPPDFGEALRQQPIPEVDGYVVERPLDAGGMGAVFLARQLEPPRQVALKVVRAGVGTPEVVARFEGERTLLARLSHPSIAAVFSAGSTREGHPYFAMEFVDGKRVTTFARDQRLDLAARLRLMVEVCDALDHAHARGIVHRDLKPSNILVADRDGTPAIKVIDFGVAKLCGTGLEGPGGLTRTGQIIGTPEYMSPQQARGQDVDTRTDLWSFGCVLFELLSGQSPFGRKTVGDTLAAILKEPPDWSLLPVATPASVRRLLRRCLVKEASDRLRSAADARLELNDALDERAPELPRNARVRRLAGLTLVGSLVGLVLGLAGSRLLVDDATSNPSETLERRLRIHIPGLRSNERFAPELSPDGRNLVYVREGLLWLRSMNALEPRPLIGTDGAEYPFWSPDGGKIGYFSGGSIRRISVDGGDPSSVIDLRGDVVNGAGATWRHDDTIVYSRGNTDLFVVPARGGARTVLFAATPDVGLHFHRPRLLGGDGLVFGVHREVGADTLAVLLGGELRIVVLTEGQRVDSPVWSPQGYVFFERNGTNAGLWGVPFDLEGPTAGEPFFVAAGGGRPTVARDGTLMYQPGVVAGEVQLGWVERSGNWVGGLGNPERDILHPRISGDGTRVVAAVRGRNRSTVVWWDLETQTTTSLTVDEDRNQVLPHWSPDDRRIVVNTNPTGAAGLFDPMLWVADVDGGRWTRLFEGWDARFTRDGSRLVFVTSELDIAVGAADGSGVPTKILASELEEREPELSPDNRLLAYWTNARGVWNVVLTRFPAPSGGWSVSPDGGGKPRWNRAGDRLFYTHRNCVFEVVVQQSPDVRVGPPQQLFCGDELDLNLERGYDVSADGFRFLVVRDLFEGRGRGEEAVLLSDWIR